MIYVRKSEFLSTGFTHKGVTLIELLLVISIFLIVGVTSGSIASNFLVRNNLQNKVNEVVSTLRVAQLNSISSKGVNSLGVKPPLYTALQNLFPGRPKWCPIQAVYCPGLIPQKRHLRSMAIMSLTLSPFAAISSSFVGLFIIIDYRTSEKLPLLKPQFLSLPGKP